jgi:CopG family nickel-responsive transcriptional regulator
MSDGEKSKMSESERVTIRIPQDKVNALQILVEKGKFETISDAVRAAIDEFVKNELTPENIKKMTVDLPKGNVIELEALVNNGDSISVDDAIRNAVREYIRLKMSKAMDELDK